MAVSLAVSAINLPTFSSLPGVNNFIASAEMQRVARKGYVDFLRRQYVENEKVTCCALSSLFRWPMPQSETARQSPIWIRYSRHNCRWSVRSPQVPRRGHGSTFPTQSVQPPRARAPSAPRVLAWQPAMVTGWGEAESAQRHHAGNCPAELRPAHWLPVPQ